MPNRSLKEKMTLSRFDTVFLFTFTVIALVSSLLSALIGPLRGMLPLLIFLTTVYPLYIGVWHGIMNDRVAERLFAWEYLFLQLVYMMTTFVSSLLLALFPFEFFPGTLPGDIISMAIKPVIIFIVFFGVAIVLYDRGFNSIWDVFEDNLPSAGREVSEKRHAKTCKSHSKWASMFQSIAVIIELFAIQEWELATGILTKYPIPYSLENIPYVAALFAIIWLLTYEFLSAT